MTTCRRHIIIISNIEELKLYDGHLEIYLTSGRVIRIDNNARCIYDKISYYIRESIYSLSLSTLSQDESQKPIANVVNPTTNPPTNELQIKSTKDSKNTLI